MEAKWVQAPLRLERARRVLIPLFFAALGHDVCRNAVETDLILLLPVLLQPLLAFLGGPLVQQLPVAGVRQIGNRHPARRLHEVDRHIENLPRARERRKQGKELAPLGIARMNDSRGAIEPQDEGRTVKGTEHHRHARLLLNMGRRFIAAPGDVEPGNSPVAEHPQGIHALGRDIDATVRRGSPDKKYLLLGNELDMGVGEFAISLSHRVLPAVEGRS